MKVILYHPMNNGPSFGASMPLVNKRWKFLSILLIGILAGTLLGAPSGFTSQLSSFFEASEIINAPEILQPAYATGTLTNVFAMASNNLAGGVSWYTVTFKTASAGSVKTIEIVFPSGFAVNNVGLIEVAGIGPGTLSAPTTTKLVYSVTSPVSIPAGTGIKLMFGKIINGLSTSNQLAITTKDASAVVIDGPTKSIAFSLKKVGNSQLDSGLALTGSASIDSPTLFVDSAGNLVGIGTLTPSDKLHVNLGNSAPIDSGLTIKGSSSAGGDIGLKIINTGTGGNTWYLDSTNDASPVYGGGKLAFVEGIGNLPVMVLTEDGKVGIGTTDPEGTLEVSLPENADETNGFVVSAPSGHATLTIDKKDDTANGSAALLFKRAGSNVWVIDARRLIGGNSADLLLFSVASGKSVTIDGDSGKLVCDQCISKEGVDFMKFGTKADGEDGYQANPLLTDFTITNVDGARDGSRILVTINDSVANNCFVYDVSTEQFKMKCSNPVRVDSFLDYVVINP
jgi:hypothetical protein